MKRGEVKGHFFLQDHKLQLEKYSYIIFCLSSYCDDIDVVSTSGKSCMTFKLNVCSCVLVIYSLSRPPVPAVCDSDMCFADIAKPLAPSCGRHRWLLPLSASHSALLFLILIDLDLFLCFAVMKKREVPRDWKTLSASPCSNSHTPKTGSPLQDLLFEAEQK